MSCPRTLLHVGEPGIEPPAFRWQLCVLSYSQPKAFKKLKEQNQFLLAFLSFRAPIHCTISAVAYTSHTVPFAFAWIRCQGWYAQTLCWWVLLNCRLTDAETVELCHQYVLTVNTKFGACIGLVGHFLDCMHHHRYNKFLVCVKSCLAIKLTLIMRSLAKFDFIWPKILSCILNCKFSWTNAYSFFSNIK